MGFIQYGHLKKLASSYFNELENSTKALLFKCPITKHFFSMGTLQQKHTAMTLPQQIESTFATPFSAGTGPRCHSGTVARTYYRNLYVLIEHIHYHLGQIVLIKKLLQQQAETTSAVDRRYCARRRYSHFKKWTVL
jgi:hypothetical protein